MVAVPHRSQSPFHQRHRLFLSMVQRGVHFGHLWGSRLGITIHICGHPLPYRPESFLLKLAILWVHLTNIVQAPPSLGLGIHQVSTYETKPRPRMTLWLSMCLVYSIDSPGSYSYMSLGVESFHVIARRDSTCSHTSEWTSEPTSELSKGNVLGYYRSLGSLRYGTSPAFLAVLWAARLGCLLPRNLSCGGRAADYIARRPPILVGFGGLHTLARTPPPCIGSFFYPTGTNRPAVITVIKIGFSWRGENNLFSIQASSTQYSFHISGNRGYGSNRVRYSL